MNRVIALALLAATLSTLLQEGSTRKKTCAATKKAVKETNISLIMFRNASGEWLTDFSAERSGHDYNKDKKIDIQQTVVEGGNTIVVRVKEGVLLGNSSDGSKTGFRGQTEVIMSNEPVLTDRVLDSQEILRFHEKRGKNTVLTNGGCTAYRKEPNINDGYAGLLTNRPLRDNELFQVQIDKTQTVGIQYTVFIGVAVFSSLADIEDRYYALSKGDDIWTAGCNSLQLHGESDKYYPMCLIHLPVGTRIGVMRKHNGDLHFFLDGIDKGVAFTGILAPVHGFFDLINYVTQVSIV